MINNIKIILKEIGGKAIYVVTGYDISSKEEITKIASSLNATILDNELLVIGKSDIMYGPMSVNDFKNKFKVS